MERRPAVGRRRRLTGQPTKHKTSVWTSLGGASTLVPMGFCLAATAVDNGAVLVLITLIVLPIAAVAFARSGPPWRSVGRGPMAIDQDLPARGSRGPAPPIDPAIQAAEARQMIEAKSYRRERRGEA